MQELTQAERILEAHGQTGFQRADGKLEVLSQWTRNGRLESAWIVIERAELSAWLGY